MYKKKLLFVVLLLLSSLAVKAQDQHFSKIVSIQYQDEPLESVLKDLEEKFGLNFCYSACCVPMDRMITVKLTRQTLVALIDTVTELAGIEYKIIKKHIVLSARSHNAEQDRQRAKK